MLILWFEIFKASMELLLKKILQITGWSKNSLSIFPLSSFDKLFFLVVKQIKNSIYRVKWSKPLEAKLGNLTLYTSPPPGSGSLIIFMMRVLKDLVNVEDESILWQRIVETYKWGYARRTELGDSDIVRDVGRLKKTVNLILEWLVFNIIISSKKIYKCYPF